MINNYKQLFAFEHEEFALPGFYLLKVSVNYTDSLIWLVGESGSYGIVSIELSITTEEIDKIKNEGIEYFIQFIDNSKELDEIFLQLFDSY